MQPIIRERVLYAHAFFSGMKVIIEHLDGEVYPWSILEYKHISKIIGKENLTFTNIKKEEQHKLKELGNVTEERASDLDFERKRMCVLDPKAKEILKPEDADKFDVFVFGGVLGNHPMDGRTEKQLTATLPGCGLRSLGDVQMSTNTAVLVSKRIIDDKIPFEKLKFEDEIEIELEDGFSTILPYRYLVENSKTVLPEGLIEFLKSEENTF